MDPVIGDDLPTAVMDAKKFVMNHSLVMSVSFMARSESV